MNINRVGFDPDQVVHEQFESYGHYLAGDHSPVEIESQDGRPLLSFQSEHQVIVPISEIIAAHSIPNEDTTRESSRSVWIKFCSPSQVAQIRQLGGSSTRPVIRADQEVFYDVQTMRELKGSQYAKLRNKKKVLEDPDFVLRALSTSTLPDALLVNELWRSQRADIYARDRSQAEGSLMRAIAHGKSTTETQGVVLYYRDQPAGISIYDFSRDDVLIACITKGINDARRSGTTKASSYLYFYLFETAFAKGKTRINDGDLGTEEGTRNHKLQFRPSQLTRTYDVEII